MHVPEGEQGPGSRSASFVAPDDLASTHDYGVVEERLASPTLGRDTGALPVPVAVRERM